MPDPREAAALAWLESLGNSQSPKSAPGSSQPRAGSFESFPFSNGGQSGGYTGGKADRMTMNWRPGDAGPNRLFQQDGKLLRERAWDLYRNNPFARSAIAAYVANVIECGIVPESDDETWEREWNRWCGMTAHGTRECDLSRDCTMVELQSLWLTEVLVGGGCLVHYVTVPRRSQRIPLSIELISEERFADSLLMSGTNPKTSNPVQNGIEIDPATGRTVAYHIYAALPNDLSFDPTRTIRLPADQCEYAFLKHRERIGAKRGTTIMKTAIIWLWALGYYTDNELKASDMKSSWAYLVKTELQDNPLGGITGKVTDLNGNPVTNHAAGMIYTGGPNDSIEGSGPNVPGSDSLPWLQMIQRTISVGVELSYEEVFRDYSQGSFSSVRMSRGQDKKRFKPLQNFTINHFSNPTVNRFESAAVGALIPGFPHPEQYAEVRDEWLYETEWQTPGWESPNPKDDAAAHHQMIADGTISRHEIAGASGRSWKRTQTYLEREERIRIAGGLAPSAGTQAALDMTTPGDQVPPEEQSRDKGRSTR